jgi:beta-mannanase
VVRWYQDWTPDSSYTLVSAEMLEALRARGAAPMVTWEPWDHRSGRVQGAYSLRRIAAGQFDELLVRGAREAAAWGRPLFVRFAHEMNGRWYPWGRAANRPRDYIAAWRHVVGIFRAEGATNVRWVWSPNVDDGTMPFRAHYPGDRWVDWVALDGYNWGRLHGPEGWQSLGQVFGPSYDVLTRMTSKPVMLAELGATEHGGSKADWIRDALLRELPARMPKVRAFVWFDVEAEADWRTTSSPGAFEAFRQAVRTSAYAAPGASLYDVARYARPRGRNARTRGRAGS